MVNWNKDSFCADLSNLIGIIIKNEVPIDPSQLYKMESIVINATDTTLTIEDLVFNIHKNISGTIPLDIKEIQLLFSNSYQVNLSKLDGKEDPIENYSFTLFIKAYNSEKTSFVNSWHLDKTEVASPPKFTHPYYHFQSGGNAIEYVNSGGLVLLGTPRLPHPPMDLFLGIHFIINNFFSRKDFDWVDTIMKNHEYLDIIERAQKRMWEPYFKAFTKDNDHKDFTMKSVFPLYMKGN